MGGRDLVVLTCPFSYSLDVEKQALVTSPLRNSATVSLFVKTDRRNGHALLVDS